MVAVHLGSDKRGLGGEADDHTDALCLDRARAARGPADPVIIDHPRQRRVTCPAPSWRTPGSSARTLKRIQSGEEEWWQTPTVDLLPLLPKARGVVVERLDEFGIVGCMRFNMLHPPFDNVKLRRALLPAINQADFCGLHQNGHRLSAQRRRKCTGKPAH